MSEKILNIYCTGCGSPAKFDIVNQVYQCAHCGGTVKIDEALKEKKGFREFQRRKIKESAKNYELFSARCEGCGATVVVEEGEVLSSCDFCGRNVVREKFVKSGEMPECIIPFAVTEDEAKKQLEDWCDKNSGKREAKHIKPLIKDLKGYYLPYEMVRGPISATTSREDSYGIHDWNGYINDEFINRSDQLDNLLLDGMEPFDTDALTEFDFSYVAGHRIKTSDMSEERIPYRIMEEVKSSYMPALSRIFNSGALTTVVNVDEVLRMPALMPVYYINSGGSMAAVNGQTGKVSVRAEKTKSYIFLPWWLKAILMTLLFGAILFGVLSLGSWTLPEKLGIAGMVSGYFLVVLLVMYSYTYRTGFLVEKARDIFTSGEQTFKREHGRLVQNEEILKRKVGAPAFIRNIEGKPTSVMLRFKSAERMIKMFALAGAIMFLPVILALFINGFNFHQLNLGGSAAWFCITVPTIPIYILKFGFVELYENPWLYLIGEDGALTRYKKKVDMDRKKVGEIIKMILGCLILPPISLAVWFGIACFAAMTYLTAFGW